MNNNDIQGSLSVSQGTTIGGNLAVRGTSTFDHNVKIKGWIDAKNIKGPLKGLFKSEDELKLAYPEPQPGWFALIGNTLPAEVYRVENGEWADTGQQGGGIFLSLDGMEEDINNAQNDILELQTLVSDGVLVAGSVVISSDATTATMTYRLKKRDDSTKDYTVTVPIASESSAGMMSAADKKMITTTINLTDLDFDLSMIGKIISGSNSCKFVVMRNSKNVGILECFSDDMMHMLTQVFTTHYIAPFSGGALTHSDNKIYQYFRSYHLSGGTSTIPSRTWGEWKLVFSSDINTETVKLGEQDPSGVPVAPEVTADYANKALKDWDGNDLRKAMYMSGVLDYEEFSTSKEYAVGKVVSYLNKAYKFIAPHSAGAWDESQVEETNLKNEVENEIKKGVGGNKILEWNTDAATTCKQVPSEERKAGLQISYKNSDGVWVNEQYIGTAFDDNEWVDDANWSKIPNSKLVLDIDNRLDDIEYQLFSKAVEEEVLAEETQELHSGIYRIVDSIHLKANIETTLTVTLSDIKGSPNWGFKQSSPSSVDILQGQTGSKEYRFTPESDTVVYLWVAVGSGDTGTISVKIVQSKYNPGYVEKINKNTNDIADINKDLQQLFEYTENTVELVNVDDELKADTYRVADNIEVKKDSLVTLHVEFSSEGNAYWGLKMSKPSLKDILTDERGNKDYTFTSDVDSVLYLWVVNNSGDSGNIKVTITQPQKGEPYVETIKKNKEKIDSLDLLVRGTDDETIINQDFEINSTNAYRVLDGINIKANSVYEITCIGDIFSNSIPSSQIGIKQSSPELKDLFTDSNVYNKTIQYKPSINSTIYIWVNNAIVGSSLNIQIVKKGDESLKQNIVDSIEYPALKNIDGVEDCSLENLFDPAKTEAYDSAFAEKVYSAIGRKTGETGCYSAPIPCKEGDYFTRTGLGTGIVVVMDSIGNILGDIKNAAYNSTIQIKASEEQDFSAAASVSFVVMVAEKSDVKIVKAKYVPAYTGDFLTIPNLQIKQENMSPDVITYIQGTSGKRYQLQIDDLGEELTLKFTALEGIPSSQLPSDFPKLKSTGDFSKYYDYIIFSMRNAGQPYVVQMNSRGEIVRYLKKEINCFKTIIEDGKRYYYGATGTPNSSSGELIIYEEDGETFKQVGEPVKFTTGEVIEPHDTLVISVSEKHYILQRYVPNTTTTVDGQPKTVIALHVEEQYNGEQVWLWKSEDYPELWNDSNYQNNNDDYLHNNTIYLDKDGNLCLNNKQANQILVVKRTWDDELKTGSIGEILWKIGGNSSKPTYDVPTRIKTTSIQQWFESHSAFVNLDGLWTMFDNRSEAPSRIIEFEVDYDAKNIKESTFKKYTMKSYFGRYMGSADKLGEGVYLVSWGSTKSSGTPMLGLYDFTNSKTIFELDSDNIGRSVYRVYGFKKQ